MKRDNKGFSLVELIICIAIMAIVLGMLVGSLNYIGNSQARALANAIKTSVGQTRIQTMGKYETYLYLYKGADGRYYKEIWKRSSAESDNFTHDREIIGKNKPLVKYQIKNDPNWYELSTGSDGLMISFDRSSGKEIEGNVSNPVLPTGSKDGDNNVIEDIVPVLCKTVVVSYGTMEYTITIVPETGKVSL